MLSHILDVPVLIYSSEVRSGQDAIRRLNRRDHQRDPDGSSQGISQHHSSHIMASINVLLSSEREKSRTDDGLSVHVLADTVSRHEETTKLPYTTRGSIRPHSRHSSSFLRTVDTRPTETLMEISWSSLAWMSSDPTGPPLRKISMDCEISSSTSAQHMEGGVWMEPMVSIPMISIRGNMMMLGSSSSEVRYQRWRISGVSETSHFFAISLSI